MPRRIKRWHKRFKSKVASPTVTNRPSKRKQWTDQQMLAAIEAVENGCGTNQAAKEHGVPMSTLKDRLSGRVVHGTNPGPRPYLSKREEDELADYLVQTAKVGYGKTRRQVKCIVEKVADEKGTLKVKGKVSDGWWRRFLERHPQLSLRAGDATAHVRMDAVNTENISYYYRILRECLEENDLFTHPEQIYNMDEMGMPLDPKPPKIVAQKGQKKVRYRTSGKKNQITVLGCANAVGQPQPPFVIFDAKQLNPRWTRSEVPGTRYGLSSSGWTDQVLFKGWLVEHFITHAVQGRPLLLLLDGHSSHFEPETIKFAKENSIIIFCLPPHTTHEAQPLDYSLFGPLKHHWRSACHEFYQSSPGKVVSKFNFMELFSKAWLKAVTPENICAGFRTAGIVPFNPNAIATSKSTKKGEEDIDGSGEKGSDTCTNAPQFSAEQVAKFMTRLEEGYDLYDPIYASWLEQYHPESFGSYTASHPPPNSEDEGLFPPQITDNKENRQSDANLLQFSAEQISKFTRHLEEGYDLHDPVYVCWLEQYHPECLQSYTALHKDVPADQYTLACAEDSLSAFFSHVTPTEPLCTGTGGHSAMTASSATSFTPLAESSAGSGASLHTHATPATCEELTSTPSSSDSHICRPSPLSSKNSSPSTKQPSAGSPTSVSNNSTPQTNLQSARVGGNSASVSPACTTPTVGGCSASSESSASSAISGESKILTSKSQNYLSKHLTPITPLTTKSNSSRTGFARVLTSNECLAILEEQRLKKKQKAEEKGRRKLEREKKRKEKEEEMKRKREEREERLKQRKATKRKPPAKKRKMATDKSCSSTPATATGSTKPSTQPLTTSAVHRHTHIYRGTCIHRGTSSKEEEV